MTPPNLQPEQPGLVNLEPKTKQFAEGWVQTIEADTAWIHTQKQGACGTCSANKVCGTASLSQLFSPKPSLLQVKNTLNAQPGERVLISLNDSDFIKHSIMAYGIPLFGLFVMAILAQYFVLPNVGSDGVVALFGLLGLLGGWWITHRWYRPTLPKMEQILNSETVK